jgi:hypothetical protein
MACWLLLAFAAGWRVELNQEWLATFTGYSSSTPPRGWDTSRHRAPRLSSVLSRFGFT